MHFSHSRQIQAGRTELQIVKYRVPNDRRLHLTS
jgi:hypothetical protein